MADEYKASIAVLFTDSAKRDYKGPFKERYWSRVFSVFVRKANEHGLNVFFANHKEFKDGFLKTAWLRKNNRWIKVQNQEIDLVYSKFARTMFLDNKENKRAINFKYKMNEYVKIINHPVIDKFCWDKQIIHEFFPELTPKTFVVNTLNGLKTVLPEIESERIVLKPRYGTLGEEVIVIEKKKLPRKLSKNTIVQEFIDTSKGIKGVTTGYHDLRLIIANGKIDHAHIRIPKKGLLTSNVALGGKKIFIKNHNIPKNVLRIARKVDKLFKDFKPRLYSIDFLVNEKGKAYIVECNSQPMIDKYAFGKYVDLKFYDRLFEVMKTGIKIKVIETI